MSLLVGYNFQYDAGLCRSARNGSILSKTRSLTNCQAFRHVAVPFEEVLLTRNRIIHVIFDYSLCDGSIYTMQY